MNQTLTSPQLRLGTTPEGATLDWNPQNAANLIIVGATGSGKTMVASHIAAQAARQGQRLILIDPVKHGMEYLWAGGMTLMDAKSFVEAEAVTLWMEHEMERRILLLQEAGAFGISQLDEAVRPGRILVLFEGFDACLRLGEDGDRYQKDMARGIVHRLARVSGAGRSIGIGMMLIGQSMGREDFQRFANGNLLWRSSGHVLMGEGMPSATVFSKLNESTALKLHAEHALNNGTAKGYGMFENGDGTFSEFQAPHLSGDDLRDIAETRAGI